jgi:hypothetical protein
VINGVLGTAYFVEVDPTRAGSRIGNVDELI